MKHYQKHKANILRGVRENIILQGICEEYNVSVVPHGRGRVSNGVLGDFKGALNICKKPNGGDILRNIFKIISRAGWDESPSAYSKYVIQSIRKILETYPSNSDEIVEFLGDKFRGIEPLILTFHRCKPYRRNMHNGRTRLSAVRFPGSCRVPLPGCCRSDSLKHRKPNGKRTSIVVAGRLAVLGDFSHG